MKLSIPGALRAYAGAAALVLGMLAGCGGGGSSAAVAAAVNLAPLPAITLSGQVTTGEANADVATFTGSTVQLDASASKDPEGAPVTYLWTLASKPLGSMLQLSDADAQISFKPDLPGIYVVSVRVADNRGGFADKQATILVRQNLAPQAVVTMSASYSGATATAPTRNVTTGASILLDGSHSYDADGDPVSTTWELVERPAASLAALTVSGSSARFTADAAGLYRVRARGTDPSGAYSETIYPIQALGSAPVTVVVASAANVNGTSGGNAFAASVGYTVALSGANSRDPDGGALSYAWTLVSKPDASAAQLSSATGAFSQIVPDVLGDYVVKLVATDPSGASNSFFTTVSVNNRRPQPSIGSNATPIALAAGPTLRLPPGATLTLRGAGSTDADGDALTYAWTLVAKPAASSAALSSSGSPTVQLTTDVAGGYQVRLRVTDPAGAYAEQVINIDSGNTSPVAVIDRSRMSVLAGAAATASADASYDEDGDALTYAWAIDARPAGSNATLAAPNAAQLSFTPDVAGTYMASVTVSDGKNASIAYLAIKALSSVTSNVLLPFAPLQTRYSRGLDRFVAIAANPNALYTVDPFNGAVRQVALPLSVKSFSLSPDGKLAAVLHEGVVSLVDLETATLLHSSLSGGSQTDAFVTNGGVIYLIGQSGGQWVTPPISALDGRTGANLSASWDKYYGPGTFYGTQRGIFSMSKNKIFVLSAGLSPGAISYFALDPASGAVKATGDGPYGGDFDASTPFFLSGSEDLLFTSSGTFFNTDTLQYAGRLSLSNHLLSMSQSSAVDEAIVMTNTNVPNTLGVPNYEASYHRFTGPLFLPATDIALPAINGQQSYGIGIYHSANDNHVALVQTGSPTPNAAGVRYYLVTR